MTDNISISEENLAYLNEHLDLVEAYNDNDDAALHDKYHISFKGLGKIFGISRDDSHRHVRFRTDCIYTYRRYWKPMLTYVCEHDDNTPPILK